MLERKLAAGIEAARSQLPPPTAIAQVWNIKSLDTLVFVEQTPIVSPLKM